MQSIIKSSQICNVENRNILFGAQNIISSVEYIKHKNIGGELVSLDFFKAYDRGFFTISAKSSGQNEFWSNFLWMDCFVASRS